MGLLSFLIDLVLGAAFFVGVIGTVAGLISLARFLFDRRAIPRAARIRNAGPPSWALTLLVEVDDEAGLLRPSVQLRGSPVLWPARVRLELVNEQGVIRRSCGRPLPSRSIGTELPLPTFLPPDGADVEEVLGWHWDVVIQDDLRERARWREHPATAGQLNTEAELEMSGVSWSPGV